MSGSELLKITYEEKERIRNKKKERKLSESFVNKI